MQLTSSAADFGSRVSQLEVLSSHVPSDPTGGSFEVADSTWECSDNDQASFRHPLTQASASAVQCEVRQEWWAYWRCFRCERWAVQARRCLLNLRHARMLRTPTPVKCIIEELIQLRSFRSSYHASPHRRSSRFRSFVT